MFFKKWAAAFLLKLKIFLITRMSKERNERGGNGDAPVTSSGLGKEGSNFWWARKRKRLLTLYRLLNSLETVTPPSILLKRGVTVSNNNFTTSNGTILKSSLLGKSDLQCKIKETLLISELKPGT